MKYHYMLPLDVYYIIMSKLDNRTLLSMRRTCPALYKMDINPFLRDNLRKTTRISVDKYNTRGLMRLSKFTFENKNISAGFKHSLILTHNKQVYAFGSNNYGQLGLTDYYNTVTPTLITGLNTYNHYPVCVITGYNHSLVLTNDNRVYTFGFNHHGQLGIGEDYDTCSIPILISTTEIGDNIVQISAIADQSFVLIDTGKIYAFGSNQYGELGLPDKRDYHIPTVIANLNNIISISVGLSHSLALTKDNKLYIFGQNSQTVSNANHFAGNGGKLIPKFVYDEYIDDYFIEQQGDDDVYEMNNDTIMAKYSNNKINDSIATNNFIDHRFDDHNIIQMATGTHHSLILLENGECYALGNNDHGQLGLSDNRYIRETPELLEFSGYGYGKAYMSNVVNISAGHNHSLLSTADGHLYGFGANKSRQLGLNNVSMQNFPVSINNASLANPGNIIQISCGMNHSIILYDNGEIYGFGSNICGQLGMGYYTIQVSEPMLIMVI